MKKVATRYKEDSGATDAETVTTGNTLQKLREVRRKEFELKRLVEGKLRFSTWERNSDQKGELKTGKSTLSREGTMARSTRRPGAKKKRSQGDIRRSLEDVPIRGKAQ